MADAEHLNWLRQGVKAWNEWRKQNLEVNPDLSGAADLRGANWWDVSLSGTADLRGANLWNTNLSKANLRGVDLCKVDLRGADLRGADLSRADLRGADLSRADLNSVNLHRADLSEATLRGITLSRATLREADLSEADLSGSTLRGATLRRAILRRVTVLNTNFEKAVFTGACLEDWNTNSATNFEGSVCDYVYLKYDYFEEFQERRPREGSFQPGEFAALFQQAVDTVDLIFKDGIDWQAFFQAFQELRHQYTDDNLSIQAIERKPGKAFVVRLEVAEDADKSAIESSAKELYETKLVLIEQRYRDVLQAKEGEIFAYKEQSANLMEIIKLQASRPINVEATAVAENSNSKTDLRGAQFGGGYVAGNVEGNQYGGVINNYGSNAEDITCLLAALRDQAQAFPSDQKDDANDTLDLLERDLADEQPDQARIGRRLKKLVALAAAIGTIASGAAAVSVDVSTFTGNVIELTEKLGIPIEQVQLPPSGTS